MSGSNQVDLVSIKIHKKVIAEIAVSALEEVDGVSALPKDFIGNLKDLFGCRHYTGVSVSIDKNNQVTVEVKVLIRYGKNIPEVARQAQDAIRAAIERTVDVDLKDVNVSVYGLERGKT